MALNPATSLQVLDYIAKELDMVVIMTVNPGFGGQTFIMDMLDKIRECRKLLNRRAENVQIEVDGGIARNNIKDCFDAGADLFVTGSSIFKGDIAKNIKELLC